MNAHSERYAKAREWLLNHIDRMAVPPDGGSAFRLKRLHSLKVAEECLTIARRLKIDEHDVLLSGVIGLLHDVGRFEQYRNYGTFNDYASVDHGDLGAQTLEKNGALAQFRTREREVIVKAVRWHNKVALPQDRDSEALFHARLVRDADKLDIYRVVTERMAAPERRASFALPPGDGVSETLYRELMAGRHVCYESIRNTTEMRLMQLNWVSDINFDATVELIAERRYLDAIAGSLPDTPAVRTLVARIRRCWEQRLARAKPGAGESA